MEKRKRIALYSPYVPEHRGGGERYFFSVAEQLSKKHDVTVLLRTKEDEKKVREQYENVFHLDLSHVFFKQTGIGTSASFFKKIIETMQYDVFYYLTDGSLFFSGARKNILHIQFPFTFPMSGLIQRLKLFCWRICNTNSQFTKKIIEKAWHIRVPYVHYPYIDTEIFIPGKKENIILSVGRFFSGEQSGTHCKRQDILVKVFKNLVDQGKISGWKLVLVGSIDPGEDNARYAEQVRDMAKGYPIKIFHETSFDILKMYYATAKLYWHAAGFGVDELNEPKKVEHFGIAPLEAMSAGAVPLVVGKGGLTEIVDDGQCGFLWQTEKELAEKTITCVQDASLLERLSQNAQQKARQFSKERFVKTLYTMIGDL